MSEVLKTWKNMSISAALTLNYITYIPLLDYHLPTTGTKLHDISERSHRLAMGWITPINKVLAYISSAIAVLYCTPS